ncbi:MULTISPECIES: DUF6894 family protein [unclassified Bradyrhizobium]|uniref:DUF6894 family protein n=1 Tax=unclassified Bradyrhizobium TaxID=2631580 RepID=UPI0020B2A132|nr:MULTISPECIES: hypothetical protein [unclassified Bradyrhizobium]MCP3397144.1 hypothetical protein [Bradyrhizobium sp. CCGB20]MCP3405652.1 hypothetical protein [Bradyrhizobium sp. CCGB01]
MERYFFDFKSVHAGSRDPEGMDLPDAEAAHEVALDALMDAARAAVIEGCLDQRFAVEVRNGVGPVLEVTAVFNSRIFRRQ